MHGEPEEDKEEEDYDYEDNDANKEGTEQVKAVNDSRQGSEVEEQEKNNDCGEEDEYDRENE